MYIIQEMGNNGEWITDPSWRETFQTDRDKAIEITKAADFRMRVVKLVPIFDNGS
jgi:hypothetical protein